MIKIGLNENNEYYISDLSNEKTGDLDKYEQIAIKLKADGILYDGIILNDDGTLTVEDLSYQNPLLIGTVVESGSEGFYTIDYNYGSLDISVYQTNSYTYKKLDSVVLYDDGEGSVTTLKTLWDNAITEMQNEPDYVDYLPYITYSIGAGAAGYFVDFVDSYDKEAQKEYKAHSIALKVQNVAVFYAMANKRANIYPDVTSNLEVIHGNLVIMAEDIFDLVYGYKIFTKFSKFIEESNNSLTDYISYINEEFDKNPSELPVTIRKEIEKRLNNNKKKLSKYSFDTAIYNSTINSLYEQAISLTNRADFTEASKEIINNMNELYQGEVKSSLSIKIDETINKMAEKNGLASNTIAVSDSFDTFRAQDNVISMSFPDVNSGKPFSGVIYVAMHGALPENRNIVSYYAGYLAESIYNAMIKSGATPEQFSEIKEIIFGNCHNNEVLADYVIESFYELLEYKGITTPDSIDYRYLTDSSLVTARKSYYYMNRSIFQQMFNSKSLFLYKTFVYEVQNRAITSILDALYIRPAFKNIVKQNIGIPSKLVNINDSSAYKDLLVSCNIIKEGSMASADQEARKKAKNNYDSYARKALRNRSAVSLMKTVAPLNYQFDITKSYGENFNNLVDSVNSTINMIRDVVRLDPLPDKSSQEYKDALTKRIDFLKSRIKIDPFMFDKETLSYLASICKIDEKTFLELLLSNKDIFINSTEDMLKYTGVDYNKFISGAIKGYVGELNIENLFNSVSGELARSKIQAYIVGTEANVVVSEASISSRSGAYLPITGETTEEINQSIDNNIIVLEDMLSNETDVEKRKKLTEDIEYQKSVKEEVNTSKTKERAKQISEGFGKAGDVLDYYGMLITVTEAGELTLRIDFEDPDSIGAFCNTVGFIEGAVMVGAQLGGIAIGKMVKNMSGISYEGFKTKRLKSMEKMQKYALPIDAVLTIGAAYSIFATLDKNSKTYGYMITLGVLTIANFGVEVASFFLRSFFYPSIILDIIGFAIGLVSNLVGAATSIVGLDHFDKGEKTKDFFAALFGFNHPGELDSANEALYDQIDSIYDNGGKDNYNMIISGYFRNYDDLYMSFGYCGNGGVKNNEVSDAGNSQDAIDLVSTNFTWDQIKNSGDKNTGLGHSYIRTSSSESAEGVAYIACKNHNVHQDFNNCPYPLTIFAGYLPAVSFYSGSKVVEEWDPIFCWGGGYNINDNYGPIITLTGLNSNMFMIGDDQDTILANGTYVCQNWGACGDSFDGREGISASPSGSACKYYTHYWQSYYNILSPSYVDTSDSSYGKMILHLEQVTSKLNVDLSKPTINMLGDISGSNINNVKSPHTVLRAVTDTNRTLAADFSVISNVFINDGTTLTTHNKDLVVQTNNNAIINAQNLNDDSNVVIYAGFNDTVNMTGTTAAVEVII